jgi:hypothetical protein
VHTLRGKHVSAEIGLPAAAAQTGTVIYLNYLDILRAAPANTALL